MEIRNIYTYRGRLNFKRLSDADIQLSDCWRHGVVFGKLSVLQLKPMVYSICPLLSSQFYIKYSYAYHDSFFSNDFILYVTCTSRNLLKFLNFYKNNYYKYSDFKSVLVKFPNVHVLKYVS